MFRERWVVGVTGMLVSVFLVMLVGCKTSYRINSRWIDRDIVVDGMDREWRDGGLLYDAKSNTKIGIRNDAENLYLCLVVKDETIQRQVLEAGVTFWVCQQKRKHKLWGLRSPIGWEDRGGGEAGSFGEVSPVGPPETGGDESTLSGGPGGESERGGARTAGNRDGGLFVSLGTFDLLTSEAGQSMAPEALAKIGITGRVAQQQGGGVVCEVKIPLYKTGASPYAAVTSENGECLIGFLTEKASRSGDIRKEENGSGKGGGGKGGMSGGGMGGGAMGEGMEGGVHSGPMRGEAASCLEMWAHVDLAPAPGG